MTLLPTVSMTRAAWHALDPNQRWVRRGVRVLLDADTGERVAFVHLVRVPGDDVRDGPWRTREARLRP